MATPPRDKTVLVDDLKAADWPERLSTVLDRFMGSTVAGLAGGLTLGTNTRAQLHTALVTVPTDWALLGEVGYQAGFANWVDATYPTAAVRRTAYGMVEYRGLIRAPNPLPASGVALVYLPATYLPGSNAGPFALAGNTVTVLEVTSAANGGYLSYRSGGTATQWIALTGIRYEAADRTPPVAGCWPYDFAPTYPERPSAVLLAEVRETTTNALTTAHAPAWDWISRGGTPYVRIRNVAALVPGASYRITFLVLW